ncbi:MAG: DNA polymerase III subunit gamma/tau [bacterium]|nr:DNA polymerase III subunit gamma/tau [bacterium]
MENNISSLNQERTLYRKHRPQALSDVSGQQHILAVIKNALSGGKITHAYLFSGPRGTGKTTIARIIAKRLNCQNAQGSDPCGQCSQCIAFQNKACLDLIEIDAASNRGIDEIRALKDRISLAPTAGKYKVYIIDEVHMLTKEAFNALLKTLEEPPSHAIFILATTELHKVPETIKSRCQTFIFRRASAEQLIERLKKISGIENVEIEDSVLSLIASHSEGCFRDAEGLLGQVISMQSGKISIGDVETMLGVIGFKEIQNFVDNILTRNAQGSLQQLLRVIERGASLRRFADDITRYLRAVATFTIAQTSNESFDPEVMEKLQIHAKSYTLDSFTKLLRLFLRAKSEMRDVTYEELPLELVIMEWCGEVQNTTSLITKTQSVVSQQPIQQPVQPSVLGKMAQPIMNAPIIARESPVPTINRSQDKLATDQRNSMVENLELFEKVMVVWSQFLEKTRTLNPLLLSTLEACKPSIVRGNMLYMITEFNLYKERVTDNQVRESLEDLLASLVGEKILMRVALKSEAVGMRLPEPKSGSTVVVASIESPIAINTNPTAEALAVLGGELVGG